MAENDAKPSVVSNLQYAADNPEYLARLQEAKRTGQCIFCLPEWRMVTGRFICQVEGWVARYSDYPTADAESTPATPEKAAVKTFPQHHVLLIPDQHGDVMEASDWRILGELFNKVREQLGVKGGGLGWRWGHPDWSGATIRHRHFHFIVPRQKPNDKRESGGEPVPVYWPMG